MTFTDAINATLPPDLPRPAVVRAPDRCWCDFSNGAFFEPFNVSHWEYLSVLRLKDSLEKRQKSPDDDSLHQLPVHSDLEHNPRTSALSNVWSALKMLSPSIYRPFSSYMVPSEHHELIISSDPSPLLPQTPHPDDTPLSVPDADVKRLPLIRKEYDLEPYGFNIVLDFSWSR